MRPDCPLYTALDAIRRAPFAIADILRRIQGDAVAAFGLGPNECPYRIVASGPYWRLRDYSNHETSHSLLIVAAPIKRPYIWDLAPSASAIRYCLREGLHVHLLEWMPASRRTGDNGLDECALAISDCVAKVSVENRGSKPFLIGHSLGGTLAAIYGALAPATIRECAPWSAAVFPAGAKPVPGCTRFLGAIDSVRHGSISRLTAIARECAGIARHVHLVEAGGRCIKSHRSSCTGNSCIIERWALDEVALPGKLVHQIVEWLYRENRLCRGARDRRHARRPV